MHARVRAHKHARAHAHTYTHILGFINPCEDLDGFVNAWLSCLQTEEESTLVNYIPTSEYRKRMRSVVQWHWQTFKDQSRSHYQGKFVTGKPQGANI